MEDLRTRVWSFIVETFLFGDGDGLENDTSFMEVGIVDSTGILELVDFLENELMVAVLEADLVPENLDSVDRLVAFVERKQGVYSSLPAMG